jgi:hypothetical protein
MLLIESLKKKFAEEAEDEEAEITDDDHQEDDQEDDQEETMLRATKKAPPAACSKPPANDIEIPWMPMFSRHQYHAKGHDRFMYVIELPGSFSGEKGTYKLGIEKMGTELAFSVPMEDALVNPHSVHSLLLAEYGRIFSADSDKEHNWKESTKHMKGKKAVFRHALPFPCMKKFADDLENPGILFRKIKKGSKQEVSVLILEVKSIHHAELSDSEDENLQVATFKSPEKVQGVCGETAQKAALFEILIAKGINMDELRGEMKRVGIDDSMDIDGALKRQKKRATAPP